MTLRPKLGLAIPTLNAGSQFYKVLEAIRKQQLSGELRTIIIDSGSVDDTTFFAQKRGIEVYRIDQDKFTHGLVRQMATEILTDCDFVFLKTQDVLLHKNSLQELLSFIEQHKEMVVAYGRQVAEKARENYFEQMDRNYNYPRTNLVKSEKNTAKLGIKTVFSSDAFSVYRLSLLKKIGGFPEKIKFAEDMYVAAVAVKNGFQVGYCADAVVTHSNDLNLIELFERYKNIGIFHGQNKWIQNEFGSNEENGIGLIFSQSHKLLKDKKVMKIPELFVRSGVKYVGYILGKNMGK